MACIHGPTSDLCVCVCWPDVCSNNRVCNIRGRKNSYRGGIHRTRVVWIVYSLDDRDAPDFYVRLQ